MPSAESLPDALCLACGLCCNGVLFKDVELQAGDDAKRLAAAGLPLKARISAAKPKIKFQQPCAALCADNKCRIYAERPTRCRQFECLLFQAVARGEVEIAAALRNIRTAHRRAEKVRGLLRQLGEENETLALSLRFQRTQRRLERDLPDEETAAFYADLTLAVHDLNLLLREKFYR
jgi:Fe-S-cluster containining protein